MGINNFNWKNSLLGLFLGIGLISCEDNSEKMSFYEMEGFVNDSNYVISKGEKNVFGKNYFKMEVIPVYGKDISYSFLDLNHDCEFDLLEVNENLEKRVFSREELYPNVPEAFQKKYKSYLDSALIKNLKKIGYLK
jgi:hypothetical protein